MRPIEYAEKAIETMQKTYDAKDLPPKGRFHYHQGVFLSGVYETYQLTKKEEYFAYVKDWVDSVTTENGEFLKQDSGQLDDIQPGILLFPIYEKTKEKKYKILLDQLVKEIDEFPKTTEGAFWHKQRYPYQMWLDGLYMGGPFCVEYGAVFDRPDLWDLTIKQVLLMQEHTRDPKTGLWYHAWDEKREMPWANPVTGQSPEFWGRSIGWVPIAILDDLNYLPKNYPYVKELKKTVVDLLVAISRYQSKEDGRWYQVVDKGGQAGNWLENSCSCLFVAALCRAVSQGLLDESYLQVAKKGYRGVINSLTWEKEELQLGSICVGTGVGDYKHYCERDTSVNDLHGMGAFLLMCVEVEKIK